MKDEFAHKSSLEEIKQRFDKVFAYIEKKESPRPVAY